MQIIIGCDHAGYHLKQTVIAALREAGHEVHDVGAHGTDSVDYPEYSLAVAEPVARGEYERGIFVCGSGMGPAIVANKLPGIRAVACQNTFTARSSRRDQDANVLTLGERVLGPGVALEIVSVWLAEPFSGAPRHQRRLDQIAALEARCQRPADA